MPTYQHYSDNYSRPRIQREFLRWFIQYRSQFAVPLRISKRTRRSFELEFVGAKAMIGASLTSWGINVWFHWQGECWDFLNCFDVIPKLINNGYICTLCEYEHRVIFLSREQLWKEHLFNPFLEWINNELAQAPWIEIVGTKNEFTSARLLNSIPENIRTKSKPAEVDIIITNPTYISSEYNQ
jgi:hypothetical protein